MTNSDTADMSPPSHSSCLLTRLLRISEPTSTAARTSLCSRESPSTRQTPSYRSAERCYKTCTNPRRSPRPSSPPKLSVSPHTPSPRRSRVERIPTFFSRRLHRKRLPITSPVSIPFDILNRISPSLRRIRLRSMVSPLPHTALDTRWEVQYGIYSMGWSRSYMPSTGTKLGNMSSPELRGSEGLALVARKFWSSCVVQLP